MRRILCLASLITIVLVAIAGCESPVPEPHAAMDPASATAVEGTIRLFSAALADGDSTRIGALSEPDFLLLEDGRFYSRDSAIAGIRSVLSTGHLGRELDSIHVQLADSSAWADYRVRGWFTRGRDTMRFTLLETAVLRRDGDMWRLAQMASMPEAQARK